jgi:hypothetical protein
MIPEVQTVVDRIVEERTKFEAFCRSLNDSELSTAVPDSTWCVKDFISHLATIDGPITAWFTAVAEGSASGPRTGSGGERWNVDRFNDDAVAKLRDRSVDGILTHAATERSTLVGVLGRLTQEQVDASIHFGGDAKRPATDMQFGRYLQGWARHDVIHVADMLKALPERRTDPAVAAWLDEPDVRTLVGFYQKAMA